VLTGARGARRSPWAAFSDRHCPSPRSMGRGGGRIGGMDSMLCLDGSSGSHVSISITLTLPDVACVHLLRQRRFLFLSHLSVGRADRDRKANMLVCWFEVVVAWSTGPQTLDPLPKPSSQIRSACGIVGRVRRTRRPLNSPRQARGLRGGEQGAQSGRCPHPSSRILTGAGFGASATLETVLHFRRWV